MRTLVLALVVANAAFFTWRYNEQVEAKIAAARPVAPLAGDTPGLTLVGELDELPPPRVPPKEVTVAPAPTPIDIPDAVEDSAPAFAADAEPADSIESIDSAPVAPSGVCVHIGPFATPTEYDALRRWLVPRTTTLALESSTTAKRQLFWVYLEPKNATEAQANIADLKRQGVRDYLLINRSDLTNAISLGVFSSQDAVNRRLAEMTKKGYSPLVVPRIETTDMHWLNAELATGYGSIDAIPADVRGNAGIETLDCSRLAGTSGNHRT